MRTIEDFLTGMRGRIGNYRQRTYSKAYDAGFLISVILFLLFCWVVLSIPGFLLGGYLLCG